MTRIAVAVLAAGSSSRMGRPKQLLPLAGRTLLRHAAETALGVPGANVVVVLGANADRLGSELAGLTVTTVLSPAWADGPGTSVRAAVAAVTATPAPADAILFTTCDQPLVTPADLIRLVDAWQATGRPMAAAGYDGTVGVPALFARVCFPDLFTVSPGRGAKAVLTGSPEKVTVVPIAHAAIDLDTPEDYDRHLSRLAAGGLAAE